MATDLRNTSRPQPGDPLDMPEQPAAGHDPRAPARAGGGSAPAGTANALAQLLSAESAQIRCWAARQLGRLGAVGKEAVPQLKRALRDPDTAVRAAAGRALKAITGEPKNAGGKSAGRAWFLRVFGKALTHLADALRFPHA